MRKNQEPDKRLEKNIFISESGQAIIEFVIGLVVLISLLSLLIYLVFKIPLLKDNAILLALVGAFLGGIAWSGKQLLTAIVNHTQFHILEILSSGHPMSRNEIKPLLNKRLFVCKFIPGLEIDALQLLTQSNKIIVKDSKYTIAPSATIGTVKNSRSKSKEGS